MNKNEFLHIIFTKYNLRHGYNVNINSSTYKVWMKDRFELFTKYCFPSLVGQKNQNFKWIVLLDFETDKIYKERFASMAINFSNFIPFYIKKNESFNEVVERAIYQILPDSTKYLITSRIDNDDCYNENSVGILQSKFKHQDFEVFNFKKGLCYAPLQKMLTSYNYEKGPFLSVIEKVEHPNKLRTVYQYEHSQFSDHVSVTQIGEISYWVQLIHDKNVSNSIRGKPLRRISELKPFNIKGSVHEITFISFIKSIVRYYFRIVFGHIKWGIKFILNIK